MSDKLRDTLNQICSYSTSAPWSREPWSFKYGRKLYAGATDGHVCVLIETPNTFKSFPPETKEKGITPILREGSKPEYLKAVRMSRFAAWAKADLVERNEDYYSKDIYFQNMGFLRHSRTQAAVRIDRYLITMGLNAVSGYTVLGDTAKISVIDQRKPVWLRGKDWMIIVMTTAHSGNPTEKRTFDLLTTSE